MHYRDRGALAACVESCLAEPLVAETIVVDNEGVGDRIRRDHPEPAVRVLQMARNAGYGVAANAGLSAARGEAALVLNQDCVLLPDAAGHLLHTAGEAGAWVVGPRLLHAAGEPWPAKDRFPPPLEWSPPAEGGDGWRPVPWVSGAAMLLAPGHTDLRFDPRLFMYVEDEELCWRVWQAGGAVAYAERAEVIHQGGTATGTRWRQPAITARTLVNRARMVTWHAGTATAARSLAGALWRGAARRLPWRARERAR